MALYLIVAFMFDFRRVPNDPDSLMELTELVHKGERRGIFTDKMPASIHSYQSYNLCDLILGECLMTLTVLWN